MKFTLNTACLAETFSVPRAVVDKHIKMASGDALKVLLFIMRDITASIDAESISASTGLSKNEVEDALLFWSQCEIINIENKEKEKTVKKVISKIEKPSRADVAKRGNEDPKIMMLLREAQNRFSRSLKVNESSTLVWLVDDEGMDVSVVLMLFEYAANNNKLNIGFIEKTAIKWIESGVENVTDAEKIIKDELNQKLSWQIVCSSFGFEKRFSSKKEEELANKWVNEYGFSREMLKAAYDACVDNTTKIDLKYIDAVIDNWHKKGYKKPEDIRDDRPEKKKGTKGKKGDYAAYDLDLFESMLNSDD